MLLLSKVRDLLGLSVLLSDADIAWMRNPLPYFAAVKEKHPRVDFLLCTDTAYNNYAAAPLVRVRVEAEPEPEPEAELSP